MKAGETEAAATANGAPQQPPSRRSKGRPPAAHADGADATIHKPTAPRGRLSKQSKQEAVAVKSVANGTAGSKHKLTQTPYPPRGRARGQQRVRGQPAGATGAEHQREQGAKNQANAAKQQPAAARAAVEAAYGHRAERKRKAPARIASPSSDGEADDEGETSGSEAEADDDQHHSSSGNEQADGAPGAAVDSDDSKAGSGAESNSGSSSSESDSDSQSEQQNAVTAARKHLAAAGGKAAAKQCQRQPNRAAQGRTKQHKPPAERASSRQKGPLARLRVAAAAPASTTTTTSTQLLGGAARPIPEVTSYHQAVRRVNHQIQRISTEEHLLQTYTADGWKGASKEKVRLTDDLKRAEQTLARCKESIRQACRYCQEVHPGPPIPPAAYDSDGEVDVSDIFCAKCLKKESSDDNDLVLCDGTCNRAYHECCLNPRLVAADLPEDEGWLCPACDAMMDILIQINDYYNTEYALDTSWQDLFTEAPEQQQAMQLQRLRSGDLLSPRAGKTAAAAAGGWLAHDFPSEDEEDNSYTESDHDEVVGQHRPNKRQRPSASNHRAANAAAAGTDSGSSSGNSAGSGDGSSGSSGSDGGGSDDEAVSLHSEDETQPSGEEAAALQDPPLRRSKRATAADGVYAAALAAGASPRNEGPSSKLKGDRAGAGKSAAAAAAGGSASKHPGKRKSAAADDVDASGQGGAADEQQRLKRRRSSGGSKHKPRGGSKVDYKQLHEQLFGFAAFEGDDDVFREDSDDDYETDTHSDASD